MSKVDKWYRFRSKLLHGRLPRLDGPELKSWVKSANEAFSDFEAFFVRVFVAVVCNSELLRTIDGPQRDSWLALRYDVPSAGSEPSSVT